MAQVHSAPHHVDPDSGSPTVVVGNNVVIQRGIVTVQQTDTTTRVAQVAHNDVATQRDIIAIPHKDSATFKKYVTAQGRITENGVVGQRDVVAVTQKDSTANLVWWQEAAGLVIDSVWFDVNAGQVIAAASVMRLGGSGGAGPKGGGITMPSGLISVIRKTMHQTG